MMSDTLSHYELKGEGQDNTTDVSLKIGQMISASPSKDRLTRIEQSKMTANIFSDTQQVEKRLDLEVLGDHDSSDSEIKDYVEKQTRSKRLARRR